MLPTRPFRPFRPTLFRRPTAPLLCLLLLAAAACGRGSFDLGVGAFEVSHDRAQLWAHLADADDLDAVPVLLQVATADDFSVDSMVRSRIVQARREFDYTVHAQVENLRPSTRYYYRFLAREDLESEAPNSPVGSFRTSPPRDEAAALRFVISGDSNARFTRDRGLSFYVLSAAAAHDPDFFVYYGDTIYADSGIIGRPARTLDEYREVHRIHRQDPHLKKILSGMATYTGWDDHEVVNDYDGERVAPERFAAGARAFFEYLPARYGRPDQTTRTNRRVRWGSEVELFFLDGRQFRSAALFCNETSPDGEEGPDLLISPYPEDEVLARRFLGNNFDALRDLVEPSDPDCVENVLGAPDRTVLGAAQLAWLKNALKTSTATWKILINNTPLSTILLFPYDRWEGYPVERDDLVEFLTTEIDTSHLLVLTTDFHVNLAVERQGITEVLVGPIATGTFGQTLIEQIPPELADSFPPGLVFGLADAIFGTVNGTFLGSSYDALSYALVEIFEDSEGESRLRVTVRGDPDYADATNDPAAVRDLFSFEMPRP